MLKGGGRGVGAPQRGSSRQRAELCNLVGNLRQLLAHLRRLLPRLGHHLLRRLVHKLGVGQPAVEARQLLLQLGLLLLQPLNLLGCRGGGRQSVR